MKFIEQGHVRVGPDTITDPAFLVTRCVSRSAERHFERLGSRYLLNRHMEDFVTWVDTSKLKRTMLDARKVKEERRRKHTRAGENKPKAERRKVVVAEQT